MGGGEGCGRTKNMNKNECTHSGGWENKPSFQQQEEEEDVMEEEEVGEEEVGEVQEEEV